MRNLVSKPNRGYCYCPGQKQPHQDFQQTSPPIPSHNPANSLPDRLSSLKMPREKATVFGMLDNTSKPKKPKQRYHALPPSLQTNFFSVIPAATTD